MGTGGEAHNAASPLVDLAIRRAQVLGVDEPYTPDKSAILSWHLRTKDQCRFRLRTLGLLHLSNLATHFKE